MFKLLRFSPALLLLSSGVMAKEPVALAPIGKWNLHYAETSCQLIRQFGDPAKPASLVLERMSPNSALSLLVFGGPLRARVGSGTATFAFRPIPADKEQIGTIAETVEKKETALFWSGLSLVSDPASSARILLKPPERPTRDPAQQAEFHATELASAAKVTDIEITEPGGRKTRILTGPLDRALSLMRECGREKMEAAGIDLTVHDRIVRPAIGTEPLARLFTSSDYPSPAVFEGSQSVVAARLNIGADGKVTRCTSLTRFRDPGFAKVVCKNLGRARFLPAELADGTKVPDLVVTSVRFEMPR